jgi:hypothetical protein
MHNLSFVTVVYESEYPLAVLQARSLARYVQLDLIHEIILIDNSDQPMPAQWATEILNEYGPLRGRVRFLRAAEVCKVPLTSGWHKQQILKLTVAFLVQSEFYVVLDAKNHFVWSPGRDFFVTSDGRPCVNAYSYQEHPLRAKLEEVMDYLGLRPAAYVNFFTATVTPYTMRTQWVRELVLDIGDGSASRFAQVFVAKELAEFFLYAGWLVRAGHDLSQTFLFHQRFCSVIWQDHCAESAVQERIEVANETQAPLFSVHRIALKGMPVESCALVSAFWVRRELFQSEAAAQAFIERFRVNHSSHSTKSLLRSLPYEISQLRRRIARRLRVDK